MKLILLGDTHFDINNGNADIYNIQKRMFTEQLFPYMKKHDIKDIFQFGDFTHNRTTLSLNVQHNLKVDIFDYIEENDLQLYTLIGNHDIYYKNTLDVFSLEIFEKAYKDNLTVIKENKLMKFGSLNIQVVPWLLKDEDVNVHKKADMIFGHFEIKDYNVSKSYKATHGLEADKFDVIVYSGHYHLKQSSGLINYLGTPYQLDWGDYNETKGFYVLDTETSEVEFIENNIMKHLKVYINIEDKTFTINGFNEIIEDVKINKSTDFSIFKDNKIKIYASKELAVVKTFYENVNDVALKCNVEILKENDVLDTDEILTKVKDYSIEKSIIEVVNEDDRNVLHELISDARDLMNDSV